MEDTTKTYEVENYVKEYFSDDFFLVKGSSNFSKFSSREGIHLLRNFASVTNAMKTVQMQ